jgi:PAS domain S-box-containing protein
MTLLTKLRSSRHWRLRNLRIGVRLRLAFACILFLMLVGSSVSVWFLRDIRMQVERVSAVERRMTAVLQVDNGILTLMNQMHRAADTRNRDFFEVEAARLLAGLESDTAWASDTLRHTKPDNSRQAVILDSLNSMLDALPSRVRSLVDLARTDDWVALHARLLNQVDHTDDVVAALVGQIDADLAEARKNLLNDIQRAQHQTLQVLAATGLLSLTAAALLGLVVTRSITRPLAGLAAGTGALAQGRFGFEVSASGNDELAELAEAFNRASREIEDLYAKVRRSEAYFRSLIENASDLILILSRTGRILYASPSIAPVFGYSPEKLAGRSVRQVVHPDDAALVSQLFSGASFGPGETRAFELRVRHQDGSFRVLEGVATNLLADPNVTGIVINARDISERRVAEQSLREREEQLRQSQKMEAIGRLAGGVAHDFNNLLTVINGYSEFLLSTLEASDARHAYTQSIHEAGQRAADLTRQLLAFSRKQMLRPEVLNLNDIVRDTERMLRRLIGEDIELICRLNPELGGVEADVSQVHQVLMNLCVNARDAMPGGGRLTIETANEPHVTADMHFAGNDTDVRPGEYVMLAVSDTGHGMSEATQQRIFEPFFTTKEQGKGTGLGLATVYGIVRQSEGHIKVESVYSKGTTFRIYLPRVEHAPREENVNGAVPVLEGNETILLVEDEAEVRRLAASSLRTYGYRVMEAADAEEALRLYGAAREPMDVLLTDVVMPGMTGVELSKRLLSMSPGLKVIFVSGYADSVILRHGALDTGASLLQKPYSPAALAAKVRETLGGRGPGQGQRAL